jgi:hypothetical protein
LLSYYAGRTATTGTRKALGPLAVSAPATAKTKKALGPLAVSAPATAKTKKALDPLAVAEQYILTPFG